MLQLPARVIAEAGPKLELDLDIELELEVEFGIKVE